MCSGCHTEALEVCGQRPLRLYFEYLSMTLFNLPNTAPSAAQEVGEGLLI